MQRREFLRASCVGGLASLGGGGLLASDSSEPSRLPGESDAQYRARLARMRARAAANARATAESALPAKRPDESEAAYRARVARARAAAAARARAQKAARDYYEMRRYEVDTSAQRAAFDAFAQHAAIPALNRLGIEPVGVFYPAEDLSPIYVVLPHKRLESFATLTARLSMDQEFLYMGEAFLDAPAEKPAYKRVESSLMAAFDGMKRLETPITSPGRVIQLRIYESASVSTGQKKVDMFNNGEIDIFRKTGLHPVFFGETLIGGKMPNLTYMLVFKDDDEREANWKKFGSHPEWQALKALPEYAERKLVSNITNLLLRPAPYSQI